MLGAVACYASLAIAQDTPERPPLEGWRLAGEIVAGSYAGFAGYFVGRFIGSRVGDQWFAGPAREPTRRRIKQGLGYTAGAFATAGAVYGVGSIDNQHAEYWTTLAGTGAGFVVAVTINRLLLPTARQGESSSSRSCPPYRRGPGSPSALDRWHHRIQLHEALCTVNHESAFRSLHFAACSSRLSQPQIQFPCVQYPRYRRRRPHPNREVPRRLCLVERCRPRRRGHQGCAGTLPRESRPTSTKSSSATSFKAAPGRPRRGRLR